MESVFTQSCIANRCESYRISTFLKSLKNSSPKWIRTLPVVIIIFFNCQQPHPPKTLLQVGAIQVNAEKLTRYLKNFRQKQNLKTWIDYYRSYPMVRIIENRAMLYEHLEQYVFEQLAWRHTRKIGLLNDEKLQRFLEFYREKLMVEIYLREKAAAEIQITEAEMQAEYENHPEKYRTEPIAGISTIEFLTHEAALEIIDFCHKNSEKFVTLKLRYEHQMQTQKEIVRFFTFSNIPYAVDSQIAFQLKVDTITAPIRIPG